MSFLVDTKVLIWSLYEPERLPPEVSAVMRGGNNTLLLSHAVLWEFLAKLGRGNLMLGGETQSSARRRVAALGLEAVPILERHILASTLLPRHHNDPFDRVILAQALERQATILSADRMLPLYDVPVLWR